MWTQLARLKAVLNVFGNRRITNPSHLGPMEATLLNVNQEIRLLGPHEKHWFCGGKRSIAAAVSLLEKDKIIALPTDTIYGLAGLAANCRSLETIYRIKGRDGNKPLAICLSGINDIKDYAILDYAVERMLTDLLPGPVTIILKRHPNLNPALNPGLDNVAIRVPGSKFIRNVAKIAGPLALTSANKSNEPSTLHPSEFTSLWPQLAGIFYDTPNGKKVNGEGPRAGSTIVDLTTLGKFKIVRKGCAFNFTCNTCKRYGLQMIQD